MEGLWTANNQVLLIIYFVKVSVKIVNIFPTIRHKQLKMNWNENYGIEVIRTVLFCLLKYFAQKKTHTSFIQIS